MGDAGPRGSRVAFASGRVARSGRLMAMSRAYAVVGPLLLPLLLGVLTTVVTSWLAMPLPAGNGWFGPPTLQRLGIARATDGTLWTLSRGDSACHHVVSYWQMQISGASLMIPEADFQARRYDLAQLRRHERPRALTDLNMNAWYHATGWPLPALACSVHWKQQIRNSNITYTVRGGLQLPRDAAFNPRALPVAPIWPGFLVNALLYACLWLALIRGTHILRARRRIRRGCAPAARTRGPIFPPTPPAPSAAAARCCLVDRWRGRLARAGGLGRADGRARRPPHWAETIRQTEPGAGCGDVPLRVPRPCRP